MDVYDSLARIYCHGQFLGTGVLISPCQVLTCHHVTENAHGESFTLVFGSDAKVSTTANQVANDPTNDLALLTLDTNVCAPLPWSTD